MIKGLYEAAAGLLAEAKAHEIRANNLANVNTVGYKADSPFFRLLVKSAGSTDYPGSLAEARASCVVVGGTSIDFSQGALRQTGAPLDLAIEGDGFFVVKLGDRLGYTRAGNFQLGPDGTLQASGGFPVMGNQGQLLVPRGAALDIDPTGEVFADGQSIGSLKLVTFDDKTVLEKAGGNVLVAKQPDASSVQAQAVEVHQGFLELSNANIIEEMVSMIDGLRKFEAHEKGIRSILDDCIGRAINTLPALK